MKDRKRPHIFLSHSHHDNGFVEKLAFELHYNGADCWLDLWEMQVGDSIRRRVESGVEKADWLVVVLSQYSVESEWVNHELNMGFVRELDERGVFILPVVLDGCKVPLSLRDKLFADFRHDYQHGFDKLIERVLGLSAEDQLARRHIRLKCIECDRLIPMFIGFLSSYMTAGLSLAGSIDKLVEIMPEPLLSELIILVSEVKKGLPLNQGLRNLSHRVPTFRTHYLVGSLIVCNEVGGSVAQTLEQSTNTILTIEEGKLISKLH